LPGGGILVIVVAVRTSGWQPTPKEVPRMRSSPAPPPDPERRAEPLVDALGGSRTDRHDDASRPAVDEPAHRGPRSDPKLRLAWIAAFAVLVLVALLVLII
jgi:hypothetical protein